MRLDIRLFATLRDRAQASAITVELPAENPTIDELFGCIESQCPQLATALPSTIVAVNQEFRFREDVVHEDDEVALFPPVSGG